MKKSLLLADDLTHRKRLKADTLHRFIDHRPSPAALYPAGSSWHLRIAPTHFKRDWLRATLAILTSDHMFLQRHQRKRDFYRGKGVGKPHFNPSSIVEGAKRNWQPGVYLWAGSTYPTHARFTVYRMPVTRNLRGMKRLRSRIMFAYCCAAFLRRFYRSPLFWQGDYCYFATGAIQILHHHRHGGQNASTGGGSSWAASSRAACER